MDIFNYGEVSTLRFHAEALQKVFPKSKIMLMCRDGRDVIRSVMGRPKFYNKGSRGAYNLSPEQDDPYYTKWDKMNRFEKLCWSWQNSNKIMLQFIQPDKIFHFEGIIADYGYFKSRVLDHLDLNVSEKQWRDAVNVKSPNSSRHYDFPHWRDWSDEQEKTFVTMCGLIMEKLGYKMEDKIK